MNLYGSAISFPFRADHTGSIVTTSDKTELIVQAILDIIETRRGEAVMLPEYELQDFIFSVMDGGFAARLAYHLQEQITRYVPMVGSVEVKSEIDEQGRAQVSVRYRERGSIDAPRNLVFPVWQYQGFVSE